jgi:hypothetical protein
MYTIFTAVLRQLKKSDVMHGHSARNAVYHKAGSPLKYYSELF